MTKRCGRRTNTSSRWSSKQRISSSPFQTPPTPPTDPPFPQDVDYSTDDDQMYDIHGESKTTSSSPIDSLPVLHSMTKDCPSDEESTWNIHEASEMMSPSRSGPNCHCFGWGINLEYTRRVRNNAGRNGSIQWRGTKGSSVCKASEWTVFLDQHVGSTVCRSRGTAGHIRRALKVAMGHWTDWLTRWFQVSFVSLLCLCSFVNFSSLKT